MEHGKHIVRAVLLLVVVVVTFVVVRHFLVPESFGLYGHYRFDSVAAHASKELVHGAPGACNDCHEEQADALEVGVHSAVSCEVCHTAMGDGHIEDGKVVGKMVTQRSYRMCGWCHQKMPARPKAFPQIVLVDHVKEQGAEMSERVCWECHDDAHNPTDE